MRGIGKKENIDHKRHAISYFPQFLIYKFFYTMLVSQETLLRGQLNAQNRQRAQTQQKLYDHIQSSTLTYIGNYVWTIFFLFGLRKFSTYL